MLFSFPYHRQDTETKCGPACAQMVLDHLQPTLPTQTELRQDFKPPTGSFWQKYEDDNWAVRPDELGYALNGFGQAIHLTFTTQYNGDSTGYQTELSNAINSDQYQTYPIVPVHGAFYYKQQFDDAVQASSYSDIVGPNPDSDYDAHWIVLFKYADNGFVGNDPYFRPLRSGVTHGRSDVCKTVLIHINGSMRRIGDKNFPPINRAAISWKKIPPRRSPLVEPPPFEIPPFEPPLIQPPLLKPPPLPFRRFIIPNQLFKQGAVLTQMESLKLFTVQPCSLYLPPGTRFGTPRLVRRLDVKGRDYYLVPMLKPTSDDSTALVRVDAPTGNYLDSLYYSENPFIFDQSARQGLVQNAIPNQLTNMGKKNWKKPFKEQIDQPATEMVWLPCEQSLSAFFPFYVIKAPDQRFLVRVDGKVFSKLTY